MNSRILNSFFIPKFSPRPCPFPFSTYKRLLLVQHLWKQIMITLLKLLFCVCIFWDILCMLLFSANFCNTFHFLDSNYIYIVYGWHMIIWIWIFHLFYVHVMTSSAPSSFKPTNICGIFKRFLSIGRINRKLMW